MQAIGSPLAFARAHPDRTDRMRDGAQGLREACLRAAELRIPPAAAKRLRESAEALAAAGLEPANLEAVHERLEPLLQPGYPVRALGRSPEVLPGVGPRNTSALHRRGIDSVEDLLFMLPRAYDDRRELTRIEDLKVGLPACFEGTVSKVGTGSMRGGRRYFQAVVSDGSAAVQLKWFRGAARFQERVLPGVRLLVAGDVRRYRYAKELHHPEIDVLADDETATGLARIIPVYPTIDGIPPRTLRRIIEAAVACGVDLVDAFLPDATANELSLPGVGESLLEVHEPGPHLDPSTLAARSTPYHLRLDAEELLLLQAGLALRAERRRQRVTLPLDSLGDACRRALEALPFELTADQRKAWQEIATDLARPTPMSRLLVGDVGTGKTVLSVLGAVAANATPGLTAVLAPTELLAEQHERTFRELGAPLGLEVGLLTGSTPAAQRRVLRSRMNRGELAIVVGTHALITASVALPNLRLVVIDEQHRFGVAQRQQLQEKGDAPHLLVMTATPIPRTLALTVYGDLDHSTLRERPPGRSPVTTRVVPRSAGADVLAAVQATLKRGERVYVVYPLVEESEKQDLQDATRGFERLKRALPGVGIALVHGRMSSEERSRAMHAFASGEVSVLVSTTVIEVGVDVHAATLLVVQHAERFGLAQLHQLRGRVGRGLDAGTAILIAEPATEDSARRLAVLERSDSGFDIAEEDLRIRGAGEWLGTRQSGHVPELRLADLVRHGDLLAPARDAALRLVEADPGLAKHPELRAAIERRWGRRLDLAGVA